MRTNKDPSIYVYWKPGFPGWQSQTFVELHKLCWSSLLRHGTSQTSTFIGQASWRLPHGLPGIRSSSVSPDTASSGSISQRSSLDHACMIVSNVPCRQRTKHIFKFSFPVNKSYSIIPLFRIPRFTNSPYMPAHYLHTLPSPFTPSFLSPPTPITPYTHSLPPHTHPQHTDHHFFLRSLHVFTSSGGECVLPVDHPDSDQLLINEPLPDPSLPRSWDGCDWVRGSVGHCKSAGLLQGKIHEVSGLTPLVGWVFIVCGLHVVQICQVSRTP